MPKLSERGLSPKDVAVVQMRACVRNLNPTKADFEDAADVTLTTKQHDKVGYQFRKLQERILKPLDKHLEKRGFTDKNDHLDATAPAQAAAG